MLHQWQFWQVLFAYGPIEGVPEIWSQNTALELRTKAGSWGDRFPGLVESGPFRKTGCCYLVSWHQYPLILELLPGLTIRPVEQANFDICIYVHLSGKHELTDHETKKRRDDQSYFS